MTLSPVESWVVVVGLLVAIAVAAVAIDRLSARRTLRRFDRDLVTLGWTETTDVPIPVRSRPRLYDWAETGDFE